MPDELRLDYRTSGPVFSKREELVLWAKDDGTLHTTDQDGTDVEVGSGGGGGAGVQVLGPFNFAFDSPGISGDGHALVDIDAGTIIIKTWVIGGYLTNGFNPFQNMYLAVGHRGSWESDFKTLVHYVSPWSEGDYAGREPLKDVATPATSSSPSDALAWLAPWDATLGIGVYGNDPYTDGVGSVYALVYVPA